MHPERVRLATVLTVTATALALIGERLPSERLVGLAFGTVSILLAIAALTILRRVVLGARHVFFSYTTLTTTGYGNLIPTGTIGQSLAVIEMHRQIFLVTLVAGLVSKWRPGTAKPPLGATKAR